MVSPVAALKEPKATLRHACNYANPKTKTDYFGRRKITGSAQSNRTPSLIRDTDCVMGRVEGAQAYVRRLGMAR